MNHRGVPAGQDSTSAFRDSGAIDTGVRGALGRMARLLGVSTSAISKICVG